MRSVSGMRTYRRDMRPYLLERQQAHGEEEGARDSRHASLERANEIGLPGIW